MIAGVFNMVPLIGPWVGAVPGVAIALTTRDFGTALWVVAIMTIAQQIDNHFISPLVMQRTTSLHPAVVMLALLAGGTSAASSACSWPCRSRPRSRSWSATCGGSTCSRSRSKRSPLSAIHRRSDSGAGLLEPLADYVAGEPDEPATQRMPRTQITRGRTTTPPSTADAQAVRRR